MKQKSVGAPQSTSHTVDAYTAPAKPPANLPANPPANPVVTSTQQAIRNATSNSTSNYSLRSAEELYTLSERRRPCSRYWFFAFMLAAALIVAFGTGTRISTPVAAYDAQVPRAWFELSLQLVEETPGYSPPVAARAVGYMGVTLYETVQPGMWRHGSLAGQLNGLSPIEGPAFWPRYHWPTASNAALAHMVRSLFPTATAENLVAIDQLEQRFATRFRGEVDTLTYTESVAWGRRVASAVFAWSTTDGGHEGYLRNVVTDYTPGQTRAITQAEAERNPATQWVSTPPAYAPPLQPYWGYNRPFVVPNASACPAGPPPAYDRSVMSDLFLQAIEVYLLDRHRTEEQHEIAIFWADDPGQTATPPGHWISILNQVLAAEDANLALAGEAYARLGIAVADSFITCWATKYEYNLVRPITFIQNEIEPEWYPDGLIAGAIVTPPFPEYTSGHSVQSAAAATVLTHMFGADYAFTDATHVARGLPARRYPSFDAAAEEAALSRLYGGIHFRAAVIDGLTQGRCVGEHVNTLRFARF